MPDLAGGKLRLDRPAPHVARLTIDNPEKRNALDHEILDAIAQTVAEICCEEGQAVNEGDTLVVLE